MGAYRTVTFLPESGPPHEVGALVSRDGRVEMVLNRSAAHVEGLSRYDVLTRRAGVRRLEGAVDLDAPPEGLGRRFMLGKRTPLSLRGELPARFSG